VIRLSFKAALLTAQLFSGGKNLGAAGRMRGADSGTILVWLMIAAAGIAAACLALYFACRLFHRWRRSSPGALFRGLCRTHGLDRQARRLLRQIARQHGLRQPARLFTEPAWLDPASVRGTARSKAAEAARLRQRLFG
jgi:hypothetical protein